jgi:hypothetical protein
MLHPAHVPTSRYCFCTVLYLAQNTLGGGGGGGGGRQTILTLRPGMIYGIVRLFIT